MKTAHLHATATNESEPATNKPDLAADEFIMLLYVLLRRHGGSAQVSLQEALRLPSGWRDHAIVAEATDTGDIVYKLRDTSSTAATTIPLNHPSLDDLNTVGSDFS